VKYTHGQEVNVWMKKKGQLSEPFTAGDVRLILSSPVYAYGINLLPAERVADAVMQTNRQLAREVRDTGESFSLEELDRRFLALFSELEASGTCTRGEDLPPIVPKTQWLQTQLITIQKLSRGEEL
jgi:hypothetical protein